jgi:hypothetical protein
MEELTEEKKRQEVETTQKFNNEAREKELY